MLFKNKQWIIYLLISSLSFLVYSCTTEEVTPSNEVVDKEISLGDGKVFNMKYFMISIEQVTFEHFHRSTAKMTHNINQNGQVTESYWHQINIGTFGENIITSKHKIEENGVIYSSTAEASGTKAYYEYEYNEKGLINQMTVTYNDGTVNVDTFEYNELNQLIKRVPVDRYRYYTFTYDSENRVQTLEEHYESSSSSYLTKYYYNENGMPIREEGGNGVTYTYDNQNRVIETIYDSGSRDEYIYNGDQLLLKSYREENGELSLSQEKLFINKITNQQYWLSYWDEYAIKGTFDSETHKVVTKEYFLNNNYNLTLEGKNIIDVRYESGRGRKKQESFYKADGTKLYVLKHSDADRFDRETTYYKADGVTEISSKDITEEWIHRLI
ncbi:hypothetical protein [Flammeovirga sp. EKP202]|uniref:hypothetical protein n=1 Tax=Flammeovirga sp. EKP202 TaxID=2770592 RepID=UPI00165FE263|nr:hypothetical protein [Flammeovirga sp. EKP202]MBD0404546.1 hypothetical protein [Flammeovirga sp. EKP202]